MATKTITKKQTLSKAEAVVQAKPIDNPAPAPGKGRNLVGEVVSDKMEKTVVVEITRLVAHPKYHKRIRHTKKIHAHNEIGAKKGDRVEITETRPISKTKFFVVTKVIRGHS